MGYLRELLSFAASGRVLIPKEIRGRVDGRNQSILINRRLYPSAPLRIQLIGLFGAGSNLIRSFERFDYNFFSSRGINLMDCHYVTGS
jgi:hypothetical protein